ncbi:MAG: carbohydrate-binding family 9-like protein [Candidatus Latescibacterota bacterium]|nr:carbohydrate-binding family 9-like protein [Candidatus Latescibacterota bacterium]
MKMDCVTVSDVEIEDFGAERPLLYGECEALPFRCHWEGAVAMPQEGGVAYVGASSEGLSFYTRLIDSDPMSTAIQDNEPLFQLGDVAEFFIKPGVDRPEYWEIHLSPNDLMMDLLFPRRGAIGDGVATWEEIVAADSGARKRVQVLSDGWAAQLVVPWAAFDAQSAPDKGEVWQFAVCRYNYNGGLESPELSSVAPLTEAGFHRHEEYLDLVF